MFAEYDKASARAALLYAAQHVAEPTFHKVSKIFYFADRHHLEHYGSFMFGESYKALDYGPVPTQTLQLMTDVENEILDAEEEGFFVTRELVIGSLKPAPIIHSTHSPDMEELSVSMIESLEIAIALCKDKTFLELYKLSHDEAWETARIESGRRAAPMHIKAIAATLPNAESLLDFLSDPYPDAAPDASQPQYR